MKLKSGVKLERVLKAEDSFKGTIEKLMLQNGICRETDANQRPLEFNCSKNGKIYVGEPFSSRGNGTDRIYSVSGEVLEENGETVVKIYSVQRKIEFFDRYFNVFLYLTTVVIYFAVKIWKDLPISKWDFIGAGLLVLLSVWTVFSSNKEKTNKTADIDTMVNEVVKRVEAIARWND